MKYIISLLLILNTVIVSCSLYQTKHDKNNIERDAITAFCKEELLINEELSSVQSKLSNAPTNKILLQRKSEVELKISDHRILCNKKRSAYNGHSKNEYYPLVLYPVLKPNKPEE